jgi:hypothetical protein
MKTWKAGDAAVVILAAAAIIYLYISIYSGAAGSVGLVVRVKDQTWRYSLEDDFEVAVPGPLGDTVIHVEDGKVHVESSPCENQLCVAAGTVERAGEWIVCLPNQVFISIEGDVAQDDQGVDDVAF